MQDVTSALSFLRLHRWENTFMDTPARHSRSFVLLTGGTGLVGGLVLAQLMENEIPVAVLVRGNRRQTAAERCEFLMRRLEERFACYFVRPVILDGDLCQPGLGLSDADRRWIASNCSSVIHSAANLLFRPASEHLDNEPFRTNVEGTRHLLEVMTSAQITELHYVSTAYIAGLRDGVILEQETNVGQQFGNDYERSKILAEQMLRRSAVIQSLTVYRPSIVIDLNPTTSLRSDQTINSAFAMFQALSQRFGLPERGEWTHRLGCNGDERKNIVTVDWVSTMIAQIYRRPALHGSTYQLTSSNGTPASLLDDSFRAAVQSSGLKTPPRRSEAMALIDEHAAPFVAAFKSYFRDDPKFDRRNAKHAMETCGVADVPALTVKHLRDFCMRQTKPPEPVAATATGHATGHASAWNQFVHSVERRSASLVRDAAHRGTLIGLELSGPGGGQWLIEHTTQELTLHVAAVTDAAVRWIAKSVTMNQLIEMRLSVRNALEDGLLILEVNSVGDFTSPQLTASQAEQFIHQFVRIVAEIQRKVPGSIARMSEAVHDG